MVADTALNVMMLMLMMLMLLLHEIFAANFQQLKRSKAFWETCYRVEAQS